MHYACNADKTGYTFTHGLVTLEGDWDLIMDNLQVKIV